MTKKIIRMMLCSILIAGCAKLVEPGSTLSPIAVPSIAAPNPLPTPDFESPLPAPLDSPLLTPDMTSTIATPSVDNQAFIDQAKNDLAARLGLDISQIAFVRIDQVELSIPDIACSPVSSGTLSPVIPAQAIGWEIVLTARQINYTYHAHGRDSVLCTPLP